MKKFCYLLLFTLLFTACSVKLIPNSKGDDSLIGVINKKIKSGVIGQEPLIFLQGELIKAEDLNLLNEFPLKDFTAIDFLNSAEATLQYGSAGKSGAVLVTPFVDETLTMKYYEGITNKLLLDKIDAIAKQGLTRKNPILVFDGIPLQGENIANTINSLGENDIKQIDVLKKPAAYRIYGIRAINGVILITSKQG
ncbi:MAG TPA: TonB-dependent receptor plug domain-containing protein [Cyclobacteriaceae bacterium]|nr:TonB-dependent receptor plug domain-containing protein [Cyclobacteriaceae bacterium]